MTLFRYDIHGLVRLRSARRLPELEPFLLPARPANPSVDMVNPGMVDTGIVNPDRVNPGMVDAGTIDIDVRIAGNPAARAGAGIITYAEAPGRFGFSVAILPGTPTVVLASPLVGRSPHVLYTNVVEPLLRWTFVRKGYALMHGACLALGDTAVFLTARTDTGKTSTLLRALRADPRLAFLSDDMSILSPEGEVFAYPKPLTISAHTLQALGGVSLSLAERLRLQAQSRLHSKSGRAAGLWLSRAALPAATLSAVVQRLIPPPKFPVDRLVSGVRHARRARLAHIVVLERGPESVATLSRDDTLRLLAENAEDAYGFPPYPSIAPQLRMWQGDDLLPQERALVAAAVRGVGTTLLRSERFGWHERLPQLFGALQAPTTAAPDPAKPFATAPSAKAAR